MLSEHRSCRLAVSLDCIEVEIQAPLLRCVQEHTQALAHIPPVIPGCDRA